MALSVHGVGASVGDSLGPLIVGAIVLVVGWRLVFQIHFIPAMVLAVILWKGLGRIDSAKSGVNGAETYSFKAYLDGVGSIFSSSQAVAVLSSTALANMARMAVLAFIGIYFRDALGFSSFKLGLYLSLLYVLGIASQPVMGLVA